MAAKWQQWMPLDINRFRGSAAVQAMHPAARCGYLYLLMSMWETEDCSLIADPMELAELSGLGDELWAQYGPRIMRKMVTFEDGRIGNLVLLQEWEKARLVFKKRSSGGGDHAASGKSPSRVRAESEQSPSADSHTVTETVTSTETKERSSTLAPSSSELDADNPPKLSPSLALVPDPNPPTVLGEFPCDGSPKAWQFTDRDVGKWAEFFPSLDVMQELRQCYAWIDASPTRRKTARGMPRTIVAWLGRSQNRGNTHVQPNGNLAAVQGYYAGNGPLANDPLGLGRGTTRQDNPGHH